MSVAPIRPYLYLDTGKEGARHFHFLGHLRTIMVPQNHTVDRCAVTFEAGKSLLLAVHPALEGWGRFGRALRGSRR